MPTPPSPRTPFQAPALEAWKEPIERRVLGAKDMRGVVVVSGAAYGDGGGGIPGLLLGSPRDTQGNLIMLGTAYVRSAVGHGQGSNFKGSDDH